MEIRNAYIFINEIMYTLLALHVSLSWLIITRMASQYMFYLKQLTFCMCPDSYIWCVYKPISLMFIQSYAIEDSCNNLVMPHSVCGN